MAQYSTAWVRIEKELDALAAELTVVSDSTIRAQLWAARVKLLEALVVLQKRHNASLARQYKKKKAKHARKKPVQNVESVEPLGPPIEWESKL